VDDHADQGAACAKEGRRAEKEEKFVYAGIMTYEKRDGRWVRVANVSTAEPS